MGDLETLKAVATLGLTTNNVKDLVNQLRTLGVVTLCPVVASARLTEDEIVRTEKLSKRSSTNGVHCARFQVNEDSTGNELVSGGLVEVDVHAFKLEIRGTIVNARTIETVFARDLLPEGGTDLVTTLASLEVNNLTHVGCLEMCKEVL